MDQFLASPTVEVLKAFKKPELLELATRLTLEEVKPALRKPVILRKIAEHFYDEDVFTDKDLALIPDPSKGESMSDIEFKIKVMELEMQKQKLEMESQERERQFELEKLEKERQFELEKLEREKELIREREQAEIEKLKMGKYPGSTPMEAKFVASREVRLVPPFDEVEVDKYFQHFEKVAESLKWPPQYWPLMLQSVIKGKAQQAYSALSVEDSSDYEIVKHAILTAYELVPEAYRQKFRNLKKGDSQTYVEFAHEKEVYFERWCTSRAVQADFKKLKELVLIEEFKRCVKDDIKSYLDEKDAPSLQQAAKLADEYALTHKSKFSSNDRAHFYKKNDGRQNFVQGSDAKGKSNDGKGKDGKGQFKDKTTGPTCNYCKKPGHVMSECFSLKRKKEKETLPNALVKSYTRTPHTEKGPFGSSCPIEAKKAVMSDGLREEFLPFVSEGFVSLNENSAPVPISILRDTGASQSLLLEGTLPFCDETATGDFVLVQGIEGRIVSVPLHFVNLKSDLVSGQVKVGLRSSLPVKGVSLLLGNDLAGGKVVPSVQLTVKPSTEEIMEDPDVFPSCAVTRAMAKKAKAEEEDVQSGTLTHHDRVSCHDSVNGSNKSYCFDDLSDTFLNSVFDQDLGSSQNSDSLESKKSLQDVDDISLTRKQLIKEQISDPELSGLRDKALPDDEIAKVPVGYYLKDGVLMRKWRPPDIPANEDWAVINQVVVPKVYRNEILSMAHGLPLGGHLGVNKTVNKILKQFFWPGLRKDVSSFCKTCHTCQVVGKHKLDPPAAPLQPIPAFGEPFSKVIVDCVGPLPKTRLGNQYMLTIMCAATRFPEAIPLRNIKAATVAKALIKFFTLFGLPKEVQSDQGSNFMSGLFQQVIYELGVKQIRSSAYHPESQGALERFHSTLKTMIRTYCLENERDWDEGVHLLLFAARESVQESTGFSPFELVFGHQVRGPLSLFSEQWSNHDSNISLLDYVSKFKERLHRACALAKENLESSQRKMKTWYDRKARTRKFKPGDKVLVLFPLQSNPLQARFHGPYEIYSKVNDLNYVVKTPDRRKPRQLCHINMLKPYHDRSVNVVAVVESQAVNKESVIEDVFQDDEPTIKPEIIPCKLSNSEILNNIGLKLSHLNSCQQLQMKELILKYNVLFPDVPKRTSVAVHDVDVGDAKPIKQHPYRMNPEKCKLAEDEIVYMLEHKIIQPSNSNWSSPCVLVPKPNGSTRFCTDYRKVNAVSKTDAFPIPRVDDCIDKVGKAKFLTKIDLLKGYWCVPLTDRGREISAFVTPSGLYEYNVLPFGMKNAPATFQRMIHSVIKNLPNTNAYIDDLVTGSDSWEAHLEDVERLFQRLVEANLTVNLAKSEFGQAKVTYLGYVIGQGKVAPVDAKVQTIMSFPVPTGKKALRRFLGMVGYYRKFCKNFADVTLPLTNLLKKNEKFVWDEPCQKAFDRLKNMLCHFPVLRSPDFGRPFSIAVDASDDAAGAVLLQQSYGNDVEHPIAYFSKKFNQHQRNYSTIEKELLALILALQHFEVYIGTGQKPLIVYTDHNPLVFLSKMKNKNRRLLNWSLILQEIDIEIKHIKGKDNVIADCLSRC